MKKGLVHMDWVISFSIFFLYLAFIFLFLKPVRIESKSGEQILDLVESNVKEDVYWNITRVPLFVDCNGCSFTRDICLEIFPFDWNDNFIMLTDNNGNRVDFVKGSCPSPETGEFAFRASFISSTQNIFWITYSPNEGTSNVVFDCSPSCDYVVQGTIPLNTNEYLYSYGLPEFISGISNSRLQNLGLLDYSLVKTRYGLPADNEFALDVADNNGNNLFSYVNVQPGEDNVYVREWGDSILFNNGTFKQVKINLRAF